MNRKGLLLVLLSFAVLILSAPVTLLAGPVPGVPDELPRLITSRWNDSDMSASQVWYREKDGLFEAYHAGDMVLRKSDYCNSLLEAVQIYSLNKMLDRQYISETQKDVLIRMGEKLRPSQFRFFELTKVVEGPAGVKKSYDLRHGDIPVSAFVTLGDKVVETQAALWSVSGQIPNIRIKRTNTKLPWQLDEEFQDVTLDRSDYEFTFEIGRGAQEDARSIDTLVKAAALGMVNEVMAFGGSIENAYMFVHTLDGPQNRLFKMRKVPATGEKVFKVFASHVEDSNEVLIAKLTDVLALLSPATFSKRIHDVMQIGRIGWLPAAEHIFALHDSMRQELDFIHPMNPERTPIVLRNTTPVPGWFVAKIAEKYGLLDVGGPEIARYFSSVRWLDTHRRGNFIVDKSVPETMELAQHKAVGISNFDETIAAQNPDYVKLVMIAAYFYYSDELEKTYPMQRPALLAQTEFILNSSHGTVLNQASQVPGVGSRRFLSTQYKIEMNTHPEEGISVQPNIRIDGTPGYVFSQATLLRLIQDNPQLAQVARTALRKGNRQIDRHAAETIGF